MSAPKNSAPTVGRRAQWRPPTTDLDVRDPSPRTASRVAAVGLLARTPLRGSDPGGDVEAVGTDVTVPELAATAEPPAIPRWPANRTMRLDQPGR